MKYKITFVMIDGSEITASIDKPLDEFRTWLNHSKQFIDISGDMLINKAHIIRIKKG